VGALALFTGVGVAAGLRIRQPPAQPAAVRDGTSTGTGTGRARPPEAVLEADGQRRPARDAEPLSPVERIPEELSSLLPARHGPGGAAGSSQGQGQAPHAQAAHPAPGGAAPGATAARRLGYLDIYAEPWAKVIIDGHQVDTPTPIKKLPIRSGSHQLVL